MALSPVNEVVGPRAGSYIQQFGVAMISIAAVGFAVGGDAAPSSTDVLKESR